VKSLREAFEWKQYILNIPILILLTLNCK